MGGAPGSGDEDAEVTGGGCFGVVEHEVGGAVRADDFDLVRDVEFAEDFDGGLHDGEVAAAAHDDPDEGLGGGVGSGCGWNHRVRLYGRNLREITTRGALAASK